MSYRDEYHPKTKADLKKLDKPVLRELFDTHINTILDDPYEVGEALHGSLEGISTYHFSQLPVEHWHEMIGDPTIADALGELRKERRNRGAPDQAQFVSSTGGTNFV